MLIAICISINLLFSDLSFSCWGLLQEYVYREGGWNEAKWKQLKSNNIADRRMVQAKISANEMTNYHCADVQLQFRCELWIAPVFFFDISFVYICGAECCCYLYLLERIVNIQQISSWLPEAVTIFASNWLLHSTIATNGEEECKWSDTAIIK